MDVGLVYVVKVFEKDGSNTTCIGQCVADGVIRDFRDGLEFPVERQADVKPYWVQIGDTINHADDGTDVLVITNIRLQGSRIVVDVFYPSGTIGTFSISEQFCRNVTLL